jgi:hypothetical protein
MSKLSSAAQAVLDACGCGAPDSQFQLVARGFAAATLRAVADQVVPANGSRKNNEIRAEILAIADELGAQ